jgi:hypothetical protein
VSTETADEIRNGVQLEEDPVRKPALAPDTNMSQTTPADEVEEAGSDKRLESRRADRKAFFDNHWALPQQELVPRPETHRPLPPIMVSVDKPTGSHKNPNSFSNALDVPQPVAGRDAELQSRNVGPQLANAKGVTAPAGSVESTRPPALHHKSKSSMVSSPRTGLKKKEQDRAPRMGKKYTEPLKEGTEEFKDLCVEEVAASVVSDALESADIASPPPEPADKTSEEWISWKRARLSEGTRVAKRKREREDKAGDASITSPTQQQYDMSPTQAAAMGARAAAGSANTETNTHQRKRSKAEHVTSGPGNESRREAPAGTENNGQQDEVMGGGDGGEKDIVDLLLEQWTVPV